jgi:hypothetical protein
VLRQPDTPKVDRFPGTWQLLSPEIHGMHSFLASLRLLGAGSQHHSTAHRTIIHPGGSWMPTIHPHALGHAMCDALLPGPASAHSS